MAHHQNDQMETFMMRIMRGSGLTGLSAMPISRSLGKGQLLRPWLACTRQDLETFVELNRIQHIHEESNDETQFDRNWWRHELLPRLEERYPQAPQSIVKTIEALQQESELLNQLLMPIYEKVLEKQERINCQLLLEQSEALQIQLLRMWMNQLSIYPLLSKLQIQQLIRDVVQAQIDAEPVFQWQQHEIRRFDGFLYYLPKMPEVTADYKLRLKGESLTLSSGTIELKEGEGVKQAEYEVRPYQGSLKAKPTGRPSKALKKWFQEYRIPPWQRAHWPVLIVDNQVAAVPGLFVCEGHLSQSGWQLDYIVNKK